MANKTKRSRKDVESKNVFNIWYCKECDNRLEVNPDWYQDNGTPVCDHCDIDMCYHHTEIDT